MIDAQGYETDPKGTWKISYADGTVKEVEADDWAHAHRVAVGLPKSATGKKVINAIHKAGIVEAIRKGSRCDRPIVTK